MCPHNASHRGAVWAGFNVQLSAYLFHSLAHALNAYAPGKGSAFSMSLGIPLDAASVVARLQQDSFRSAAQQDVCAEASGMTLNVDQTFLHDAEQGHFLLLRQPSEIWGYLERHFDSRAFGKAGYIVPDGILQPCLIEHRGMQDVRQGANLADTAIRQALALCNGFSR